MEFNQDLFVMSFPYSDFSNVLRANELLVTCVQHSELIGKKLEKGLPLLPACIP